MRVIYDANVYISYLLSAAFPERAVVRLVSAALAGEFTLIVPADVLHELTEVIARKPHLRRAIPSTSVDDFVQLLVVRTEALDRFPDP